MPSFMTRKWIFDSFRPKNFCNESSSRIFLNKNLSKEFFNESLFVEFYNIPVNQFLGLNAK